MTTQTTPHFFTDVLIEINTPNEVVAENKIPYYVEKFDFFKTYSEGPPEGYEEFVYHDEIVRGYKKRFFRTADIKKVKAIACAYLDKLVSIAEKSTAEPNWSHAYFIKEHISGRYENADVEMKWNVLSVFFIQQYSGGRYKWRQQEVFKDICADFKWEDDPHTQLLLRYLAAQVGYALGNVAGD